MLSKIFRPTQKREKHQSARVMVHRIHWAKFLSKVAEFTQARMPELPSIGTRRVHQRPATRISHSRRVPTPVRLESRPGPLAAIHALSRFLPHARVPCSCPKQFACDREF